MKNKFEVLDKDQVYWSSTDQYELADTKTGKIHHFRVAEDSNGTDFYYKGPDGWSSLDNEDPIQAAIYEAWMDGDLYF